MTHLRCRCVHLQAQQVWARIMTDWIGHRLCIIDIIQIDISLHNTLLSLRPWLAKSRPVWAKDHCEAAAAILKWTSARRLGYLRGVTCLAIFGTDQIQLFQVPYGQDLCCNNNKCLSLNRKESTGQLARGTGHVKWGDHFLRIRLGEHWRPRRDAKVTGESVIAQCRMFHEKWNIVLGEIPETI